MRRILGWFVPCVLGACSSEPAPPPPNLDRCDDYLVPAREATGTCPSSTATSPTTYGGCDVGSGYAGRWIVDARGLPAYDFRVEERCDPAARAYSPRPYPLRDPVHMVGNGRGLVAMAHASGGIEIYTQDRGHAWVNRVELGPGDIEPNFVRQLGGAFSYVIRGEDVRSTRFEDLGIGEAERIQTRRFGIGYFETVTRFDDVEIRRVTYAPDADVRALVTEVTVTNLGPRAVNLALAEVWDPNHQQVPVALTTSDILSDTVTLTLDQQRRELNGNFDQVATWDATSRVASVRSTAKSLPLGVTDRRSISEVDYFPPEVFLAPLDAEQPDAVFLTDDELFADHVRTPPATVAAPGSAGTRSVPFDGLAQRGFLALRVPVRLAGRESRTQRFAFGYVPFGHDVGTDVATLRTPTAPDAETTLAAWKDRVVHAAFEGLSQSGAVQRELAWSTYALIANTTFDELTGLRVAGQGGSYKYIHGLDGAMGDYCLIADALPLIDPGIVRDTLLFTMSQQRASTQPTPNRYPYATTGVGAYSDVGLYAMRSDAYWLVPSSVGRYVGLTRDASFLSAEARFSPESAGERGTVLQHLARGFDYADVTLGGVAARGLLALGTNDYADGLLAQAQLSGAVASPTGTSSTFNAGLAALGLPLAADVVAPIDASLATRMRTYATDQATALTSMALDPVNGWFYRGFVDDGSPLLPGLLYLEPQVLPVIAGLVTSTQRDALLDIVSTRLETSLGAVSNIDLAGGSGGVGAPQVAGVWPVANAWVTEAYATKDPAAGWDSFIRNTLFNHAESYPGIWYGIWSGPDSTYGPDATRPGEADAHLATALTDYPVFNAHVHAAPIRALMGLLGIRGTAAGLAVSPRVPTETFSVIFPRLAVRSRPDRFEVEVRVDATGPLELRLLLPTGLRGGNPTLTIEGATSTYVRTGDEVVLTVAATASVPARVVLSP